MEEAFCVQHKGKTVCVYYCCRQDLHYIENVSLANNFHEQHSKLIAVWVKIRLVAKNNWMKAELTSLNCFPHKNIF
jgi:hypothetical protein